MTPKEQKDLLIGFRKWFAKEPFKADETMESIIDRYLATLTPTSERYKATMAFFDKLPDGLREMAKENYDDTVNSDSPTNIDDAIWQTYRNWRDSEGGFDFWFLLYNSLRDKSPSITINGTNYDLTKCYDN